MTVDVLFVFNTRFDLNENLRHMRVPKGCKPAENSRALRDTSCAGRTLALAFRHAAMGGQSCRDAKSFPSLAWNDSRQAVFRGALPSLGL
jgi:hypothetical protein